MSGCFIYSVVTEKAFRRPRTHLLLLPKATRRLQERTRMSM